ncbi:MAG: type II toxin-antitoxin system RelE/ParE family toxin, partial [Coriobacteriales bacterium]|nr:type II toxin-antitoxin system RelE/ParE family toxin [Coriobacteriales bacterium]
MTAYRVVIMPKAEKQLAKLPANSKATIRNWIDNQLDGCSNPRAKGDVRSLAGVKDGYRWR